MSLSSQRDLIALGEWLKDRFPRNKLVDEGVSVQVSEGGPARQVPFVSVVYPVRVDDPEAAYEQLKTEIGQAAVGFRLPLIVWRRLPSLERHQVTDDARLTARYCVVEAAP